jgi:hypothetical protein
MSRMPRTYIYKYVCMCVCIHVYLTRYPRYACLLVFKDCSWEFKRGDRGMPPQPPETANTNQTANSRCESSFVQQHPVHEGLLLHSAHHPSSVPTVDTVHSKDKPRLGVLEVSSRDILLGGCHGPCNRIYPLLPQSKDIYPITSSTRFLSTPACFVYTTYIRTVRSTYQCTLLQYPFDSMVQLSPGTCVSLQNQDSLQ